ncbi:hypothetical protein GGQ84_002462 [Desulfitispora alkaliphila]|uniref:hypothetical protein n=1 Tax=Desulfitispora alkaliphila TaxID=622674 RepID=UPI003D1C6DC8
MYNIGDLVFDTVKNERAKILDRSEVWGFVSYKVYNPSDESIYKISAEQVSTTAAGHSLDVNYLRYITLLSKIKNEVATGILSNLSSGIIPLPHQIDVLTFYY